MLSVLALSASFVSPGARVAALAPARASVSPAMQMRTPFTYNSVSSTAPLYNQYNGGGYSNMYNGGPYDYGGNSAMYGRGGYGRGYGPGFGAYDRGFGRYGQSYNAAGPRSWRPGVLYDAEALRSEVNSELNFCPNFEGLVLGCIDADFCK